QLLWSIYGSLPAWRAEWQSEPSLRRGNPPLRSRLCESRAECRFCLESFGYPKRLLREVAWRSENSRPWRFLDHVLPRGSELYLQFTLGRSRPYPIRYCHRGHRLHDRGARVAHTRPTGDQGIPGDLRLPDLSERLFVASSRQLYQPRSG